MRRIILAAILSLITSCASAQTSPNFTYGYVPTVAQWNAVFAGKQDYLGAPPLLTTGGTMVGPLVTAPSVVGAAGLNVPPGTAPTSPAAGDVWTDASGIYSRISGVTYNLISPASTCPACALTNFANVFTAPVQTVQGATTTSPGWYVQITGDAVARLRVGLNPSDVASIGFGGGSVTRDAFIERAGPANIRFGSPDAASPVAQISSVQNVVAGTLNAAGANRTYAGSQGTGTGLGGDIIFQTATAGGSGTSQNALSNALVIKGSGAIQVVNSLAIGGATIGGNALAVTGTSLFNSGATFGAALTYGGVTLSNAVTGTGNMVLSAGPTISGAPTFSGIPKYTGLSLGTCVNGVGLDASNNSILIACPGASSSIQIGVTTITGSPTVSDCLSVAAGPVLGNVLCARLDLADQTVTGGANVTTLGLSTGNVTIDCGSRPLQSITNNGAYTITAPAADGSCVLIVTNGASAGATTFSGFTVSANTGEPLTTVNTNKFVINILRVNAVATYLIKALQ